MMQLSLMSQSAKLFCQRQGQRGIHCLVCSLLFAGWRKVVGRRGRAADCQPHAAGGSEVLLISVGAGKWNAPSSNEELTIRRRARRRC